VSLSNYLKPLISSSVYCGHVTANRSAGCTAKFVNIGRNVVVVSKSYRVETGDYSPVKCIGTKANHRRLWFNSGRSFHSWDWGSGDYWV